MRNFKHTLADPFPELYESVLNLKIKLVIE